MQYHSRYVMREASHNHPALYGIMQDQRITRTKTVRLSMNLIQCVGGIADFENIRTAYRAEITYRGILYKLWKENSLYPTRRLEQFSPAYLEPCEWRIYITPHDLQQDLPAELWRSERWRIYVMTLD